MANILLDVPYVSQLEPYQQGPNPTAKGDCGPAVLSSAMGAKHSIKQIEIWAELPADYNRTKWGTLSLAAKQAGLVMVRKDGMGMAGLEQSLLAHTPVMCLVWYPYLPTKYDPSYVNGHYVLAVGLEQDNIIYHDPYWRKGMGAYLIAPTTNFYRAWNHTTTGADAHAPTHRQCAVLPSMTFNTKVDLYEQAKLIRWNIEEAKRESEQGDHTAVDKRLSDLIPVAYQLESRLK